MTKRITWPMGIAVATAALVLGGCNKTAPADTTPPMTTPMSPASSSSMGTSTPMDSASAPMSASSDAMSASSPMGMASGASAP